MPEYAARRGRFEKRMRQYVEAAPGPELVAETIARVVRSRRPALHNPVTREATLFPFLRTWLPRSWFEPGLRSAFRLDDESF
jgi:hypothetical protein